MLIRDLAAMNDLAVRIAAEVYAGSVVYLRGPIGAGKTTLAQALIAAHGVTEAVTSPTFSLVEVYDCRPNRRADQSSATAPCVQPPQRIWHFDLYRVEAPEELEMIGIREAFNAHDAVVIEWPERALGKLAPATIDIELRVEFSVDSDAVRDTRDIGAATESVATSSELKGLTSTADGVLRRVIVQRL